MVTQVIQDDSAALRFGEDLNVKNQLTRNDESSHSPVVRSTTTRGLHLMIRQKCKRLISMNRKTAEKKKKRQENYSSDNVSSSSCSSSLATNKQASLLLLLEQQRKKKKIPFGVSLADAQKQLNEEACEAIGMLYGYDNGVVLPPLTDRPLVRFTLVRLRQESLRFGQNVWMIRGGVHAMNDDNVGDIVAMMKCVDHKMRIPNTFGNARVDVYEVDSKEEL